MQLQMSGPDMAQHLRLTVNDLWLAFGQDQEVDRHTLLRRVSQEVERLARILERAMDDSPGRPGGTTWRATTPR